MQLNYVEKNYGGIVVGILGARNRILIYDTRRDPVRADFDPPILRPSRKLSISRVAARSSIRARPGNDPNQ
jgi:hypothetical protein